MSCASCGSQNPVGARFCPKCGNRINELPETGAGDDPSSAGPSHSPFDPQLAAYNVLRRLICRKPPFVGLSSEQSSIPDDLKSEVEFGCFVYQIGVYLALAKQRFGHVVSERTRTHLTLLAGFDPELEAGILRFLEVVRAGDAEFKAGRFSELFEGPGEDLTRYYAVLAILFLIASGCAEQRQKVLVGSVGECLLTARRTAEDVFEQELKSAREMSPAFQWSAQPGPFERQLQRQQNNPLFPTTVRVVSAQQVTDARLADLKHTADFMSTYRAIEREVLSYRPNMVVKEANDLVKRMINLISSCMVLGDYFSTEQKFLADVSDSIDQELTQTIKEPGLRDAYKNCMALTRIEGYLRTIGIALPAGQGTEDYGLRSILSEEPDLILSYANLCKNFTGLLGPTPVDSAQQVISEAVRDGMDPAQGKIKLDAFRTGWGAFESKPEAGIWASVKRLVRRR